MRALLVRGQLSTLGAGLLPLCLAACVTGPPARAPGESQAPTSATEPRVQKPAPAIKKPPPAPPTDFTFIVRSHCGDPWRATIVSSAGDHADSTPIVLRAGGRHRLTMRIQDSVLFATPAGGIIPIKFRSWEDGDGALVEVEKNCKGVTTTIRPRPHGKHLAHP